MRSAPSHSKRRAGLAFIARVTAFVALISATVRMLQSDPGRRFESMTDLIAALERGRERSRRWLVGGIAATVLGAATLGIGLPKSKSQACAATPFAEAWNEDRRASVRAAFDGAGVAYSAAAFVRLEARLDGLQSDWESHYTDACTTMLDDHEAADRLMACLRSQLDDVIAAVESLESTSNTVVGEAARIGARLPRPRRCANADRAVALPDDPAVRSEIRRLQREHARCEAMGTVKRVESGMAIADRIVESAQRIGYAPLVARALECRSELLRTAGRYEEAGEVAAEAFHTATQSDDDISALRIATLMIANLAGQARAKEAHKWVGHARSLFRRTGAGLEAEADLEDAMGELRWLF